LLSDFLKPGGVFTDKPTELAFKEESSRLMDPNGKTTNRWRSGYVAITRALNRGWYLPLGPVSWTGSTIITNGNRHEITFPY
jgi:hypothetical protein